MKKKLVLAISFTAGCAHGVELKPWLSLKDLFSQLPITLQPLSADEKRLLSTREQDMLQLIARGFSYAEISRLESISVHTVQTHIKNLYRKLAVKSKSEAVFEATRMGLLRVHG